jgi:signal transduction histidine kinase
MSRPLSFRARLTLRWTTAFGLLLAGALGLVYLGSRTYAYADLDSQIRTVAATELASSMDGEAVHLHDFPLESLGTGDFAGKFAQLYDGQGRLLDESPALRGTGFRLEAAVMAAALRGEAPLVTVGVGPRHGRMAALRATRDGAEYVLAVGLFTNHLEAALRRLAWLLSLVWLGSVAVTTAIGYALASRALAPIARITEQAATVARGDFGARLDPPRTDDEIGRMTRLLNEMLERLQGAIEANRRFAADASHELRSPLTAMAGEIDVALKRARPAAEYRETLSVVRERLTELATIADNLMLLVRAQERKPEALLKEVPLRPLVDASAARVAPLARARAIAVRLEAFPDLVAYGDPALLARVLDNLMVNAVQYNRDAGEVVVRGRLEETATDAWEACQAVVTVSDCGPGIPPDEWERIFDRFHRLDQSRSRRTGGSGLGLSISRAIVSLCKGCIHVLHSSDQGTTFEVRLPGRRGTSAACTADLVERADHPLEPPPDRLGSVL